MPSTSRSLPTVAKTPRNRSGSRKVKNAVARLRQYTRCSKRSWRGDAHRAHAVAAAVVVGGQRRGRRPPGSAARPRGRPSVDAALQRPAGERVQRGDRLVDLDLAARRRSGAAPGRAARARRVDAVRQLEADLDRGAWLASSVDGRALAPRARRRASRPRGRPRPAPRPCSASSAAPPAPRRRGRAASSRPPPRARGRSPSWARRGRRTSGSPTRARPTSSRRAWPPDSVRTRCVGLLLEPHELEHLVDGRAGAGSSRRTARSTSRTRWNGCTPLRCSTMPDALAQRRCRRVQGRRRARARRPRRRWR